MTRQGPHWISQLFRQSVAKHTRNRFSLVAVKQCAAMSSWMPGEYSHDLIEYQPPPWAAHLRGVPSHKIKLAQLPTPIHDWKLPGVNKNFGVSIKRDDMTGNTLSGNKVRKLEFLLADAVKKGCKHIITCGGIQSNHCRATATAAVQLGLLPHLFLRGDITNHADVGCRGNLFLNRLLGAHMYFVPRKSPYVTHLKPRMKTLADKLRMEHNEASYLIPVGGSDAVGMFGYLEAFNELLSQNVRSHFDDIVFACGSGGTAAGLAIANFLSGSELRIHAISVSDDAAYFHGHVDEVLTAIGLNDIKSRDILDVIDGHKGKGYGISTEEELDFITRVSCSTSIMLDPVYTGKAVRGLVHELDNNADRFKGSRILYIHTGGIFGMYDGRLDDVLTISGSATDRIHMWNDLESDPS